MIFERLRENQLYHAATVSHMEEYAKEGEIYIYYIVAYCVIQSFIKVPKQEIKWLDIYLKSAVSSGGFRQIYYPSLYIN